MNGYLDVSKPLHYSGTIIEKKRFASMSVAEMYHLKRYIKYTFLSEKTKIQQARSPKWTADFIETTN
jgi:hypothetical protein